MPNILLLVGHKDQVIYNSRDTIDDFFSTIFIIHPIPVTLFLAVNRWFRDTGFEGQLWVGLLQGTQFVVSVWDIKEDNEFSDIPSGR